MAKEARFPENVIRAIFERDRHRCVKCGRSSPLESIPHHIVFRSQGGRGEKRNGATVCVYCHRGVHHGKNTEESRRWFVDWAERTLDENGDYKFDDLLDYE